MSMIIGKALIAGGGFGGFVGGDFFGKRFILGGGGVLLTG